ncbi:MULTISPECIES: hypothetical protein [Treponema]|uniref:Lipoprotein n=1 Tax=Treponema denticola (strain ATCC 35405 / DSM 14222 / CIP 103919 / JCM 8153 / KCTC 15104) TaxID=243275 RepID=Q73NL7_TREDE|nr:MULTISPECIES: hypothetical protein [Treponema]AAS11624.1 hypothetical protein TDE_1135 [Treponema denticola ATCC 35405]HCY96430.1 hypothetical protein [Treponema sp.]
MNEKKFFIFMFVCVLLFSLSSCCTRSGIHNHGSRADEVRESVGEVREHQTDAIISNTELGNRIKRGAEISRELNRSIDSSEAIFEEIREIIRRIRKRKHRDDSKERSEDTGKAKED